MTRNSLQFLRRGRNVRLDQFSPRTTVLDWLRLQERVDRHQGRLRGRRLRRLHRGGGARARRPAGLRAGQFLHHAARPVGRRRADHSRRPRRRTACCIRCRQRWSREHGSQCGFCTPGIVMSLFAHYHRCDGAPSRADDQRCAGRQPVPLHRLPADRRRRASMPATAGADDRFTPQRGGTAGRRSRALDDEADLFVGDDAAFSPRRRASIRCALLYAQHPDATIVAGATDVGLWITKKLTPHRKDHPRRPRRRACARSSETADGYAFGAVVSLARAAPVLGSIDPDIAELLRRFGSMQVRACGTVGGNIANGSPIGDLAPMLIALGRRRWSCASGEHVRATAAGGLLSRLRQAGSHSRANLCAGCWCRSCRRPRSFAPTRSPSASTRTSRRCWRPFA